MNFIFKYGESGITTVLGAYKKDPIYNFEDFITLKNLLNEKKILRSSNELSLLASVLIKWIDLHKDRFTGQSISEIEKNKFKKFSSTFDLLHSMYHKINKYLATPEKCSLWDYRYFTDSTRFSTLAKSISDELAEVDEKVVGTSIEELTSFDLIKKVDDKYHASDLGMWLYKTCRSEV